MIVGFREAKEIHQAALWLGGLEAVTDVLRDSEDLFMATLYKWLCTILSIVLTTQGVRLTGR